MSITFLTFFEPKSSSTKEYVKTTAGKNSHKRPISGHIPIKEAKNASSRDNVTEYATLSFFFIKI